MSTTRKIKADLIEGVVAPINYIRKGAGENIITGWNRFFDSGTRPVDGTGGSPNANVTWTLSSSSPLDGDASFLLTKDANNRQGEGVSYDFTIKNKDLAKVLRIGFDYEIVSGTYNPGTSSTDSDVIFYLYRVTATGRLIEPSIFKLDGGVSGIKYSFRSEFQTDSDATEYRAIIYIASTSASAYTLKFDNFEITPSKNTYGAIVTDWVSYTPTISNFGTVSSVQFEYRRNGDSLDIRGKFVSGTPAAAEAQIGLPPGFTSATTSKIPSIKAAGLFGASSSLTNYHMLMIEPSVTYFTVGLQSVAGGVFAKRNATALVSAADSVTIAASGIPVQGLGASAILGQDSDTRVTAALLGQSASQSIPTGFTDTLVQFDTKTIDTHGATTTGASAKFTAPLAGLYSVKAQVCYAGAGAGIRYVIRIRKNGTVINSFELDYTAVGVGLITLPVNTLVSLVAGDTVDIVTAQSNAASLSLSGGTAFNYVSVERMSGPSQLAASEAVVLSVAGTTSTVTSSQATVAPWTTVEIDTNGSFNSTTGVWTCPSAGIYEISAQLRFGWASVTVGQAMLISIYKNNTTDIALNQETIDVSTKTFAVLNVDKTTRLVAGDTIRIQAANAATTPTLNPPATYGLFSIKKIG